MLSINCITVFYFLFYYNFFIPHWNGDIICMQTSLKEVSRWSDFSKETPSRNNSRIYFGSRSAYLSLKCSLQNDDRSRDPFFFFFWNVIHFTATSVGDLVDISPCIICPEVLPLEQHLFFRRVRNDELTRCSI